MKRMNDAIWMSPSVSVGSTAWRRRDVTSPSRPYSLSPDGGSSGQASEKSRMSMMPSQKLGNETPKSDTAEPMVSQTLPRRTAASTPSGMATARATASAPAVSCSVGPSRSTMSVATGSFVLNDRPRSPRRAADTQPAYWVTSGRSNPRRCRTRAAASGENSPPTSTASGPPGATRMIANRMIETPKSISTAKPSRLRT